MSKINKKFWQFKNASAGNGELMLYGDIASSTWWGDEVTPKDFKKELDALGKITHLDVYVNSNGGDIFAGQAIYVMLQRIDARVDFLRILLQIRLEWLQVLQKISP